MTQDLNDIPDQPDTGSEVAVSQQDWEDLVTEWQQAGTAAQEAFARLTWPSIEVQALDAWLSAVERHTVAKTRLAALAELQLRKH